ncbi:hypothetical protein KO361_04120 [Candidatus Woesearchaeota archaeon]|nr:hypothetical protein [Candidatus Woesearchaeota archaeon]
MGILVACLTTGKGTWNNVKELINSEEWKKIYLITNKFGKENYKTNKEIKFIEIELSEPIEILRDKIVIGLTELKKEIGFNDVAINLSSGTGKEHMAIISAILRIGTGIRIVSSENKTLKTL